MPAPKIKDEVGFVSRLSQGTAAHILSLPLGRFRSWDPPRSDDGTYDAATLVQWLLAREVESAKAAAGTDQKVAVEALERKRAADADMAEMKRDQMRLELWPTERVMEIIGSAAEAVRLRLEKLGKRHREAQDAINEAMRGAAEDVRRSLNDPANRTP